MVDRDVPSFQKLGIALLQRWLGGDWQDLTIGKPQTRPGYVLLECHAENAELVKAFISEFERPKGAEQLFALLNEAKTWRDEHQKLLARIQNLESGKKKSTAR